MFQLLLKEKLLSEYESISKLQDPAMVDHYRRPNNILQLIRAVRREVGDPIAKPINKTKALLIKFYSVERPNQTFTQNESDAEKEAKRSIKHFVERGTWDQVKTFIYLQYKAGKKVDLTDMVQFLEQVKLHKSGQYSLRRARQMLTNMNMSHFKPTS